MVGVAGAAAEPIFAVDGASAWAARLTVVLAMVLAKDGAAVMGAAVIGAAVVAAAVAVATEVAYDDTPQAVPEAGPDTTALTVMPPLSRLT